ncbi:QacE family quaternary ammonium compound efflux SMR transporter [Paenibacillus sp. MY03]|jgi:paired small multidrug resistance pump|uniref:QacE family quaternary ammonium compound efflux SMR transporter n=1 Tax=Paenibacillus agaridevorans TaxID=171404 RepID=A0A2R5EVV8_9BACL|nr:MULTISPECIES: multidrug efflux SMR transporter [Paenibacillus]OUS75303.1 QacE family quaternary ammonium compound efflux SMR transporter [Paenibacillus sp. MY03]GBG07923.1 QacE family quaternary ammonium compound efflux SMR transporter [Paenibacillus agaridevorans]
MSWLFVILAGMLEVVGVVGISELNKRVSARSILMLGGGFLASFIFMSLAMKDLPMGTVYAVWTGIGTVGSALVGILFYKEPRTPLRLFFMALVLASVIGLKLIG